MFSFCASCGKEFEHVRSSGKYCQRSCQPNRKFNNFTEAQKLLARERSIRYYYNLSLERKAERSKQQAKVAKEKGWPHSGIHKHTTQLLEKQGDWCGLCGLSLDGDITVDHIKPKSAGGSDAQYNLTLAHSKCNSSKHTTPFITWALLRKAPYPEG